jgi:hypothetical protein
VIKGLVNNELTGMWKAAVFCLNICVRGLRKSTRTYLGWQVSGSQYRETSFPVNGQVIYRYAPHNDVSVNDGPHIRRWSRNIIILTTALQMPPVFSTVTCCTGL